MKEQDRMAIEFACLRLVTTYCHLVDHGEASRIASLFTRDGRLTADQVNMDGQEAIRAGMQIREDNKARMSRHVCNNFLLNQIGADEARGVVYITLYRHEGEVGRKSSPLDGPVAVGEYRDHFVRTSDGWKIKHRAFVADFIKEGAV